MEGESDRGPPRPSIAAQRPPTRDQQGEGEPSHSRNRDPRLRDRRGESSRIPRVHRSPPDQQDPGRGETHESQGPRIRRDSRDLRESRGRGDPRGPKPIGDPQDPRDPRGRGDPRDTRGPIPIGDPQDPRDPRGRGDSRRERGDIDEPRNRGHQRGRGVEGRFRGDPRTHRAAPSESSHEQPSTNRADPGNPDFASDPNQSGVKGRSVRDRSRESVRRDFSGALEGDQIEPFIRGDNARQSRESLESSHRRIARRERRERPPSWSSASEDPRGDAEGPPRQTRERSDPRLSRRRHEPRERVLVTDSDQTPDREHARPRPVRGGMAPHHGRISPTRGRGHSRDPARSNQRGPPPDIRTTISPPSSSARDSPTSGPLDGYKADISPSIDSPLPSSHGGATPRINRARSPARARSPSRIKSAERPRDLLALDDRSRDSRDPRGAVTPRDDARKREQLDLAPGSGQQQNLATTPSGQHGRFPSQRGRSRPRGGMVSNEAIPLNRRQSVSPPPDERLQERRPSNRDIPAALTPVIAPPLGQELNDDRRKSISQQHLPLQPSLELSKRNSVIIHPTEPDKVENQRKNSDQSEVSKLREKQIPSNPPSGNGTPSPAPSRTFPSRFQQDDGPNIELIRKAMKVSQRAGTAHALNMPANARQNVMFYQNRFVVKPQSGADSTSDQSAAAGVKRPLTLSSENKADGVLPQNETVQALELANKMSANRPIEMDPTSVTMETDVIKPQKRTVLRRILSILEDDRVKSSHGSIDLTQGQDTHRTLKRALNIIFVTIGILLFIAVVVVIIYTQIAGSADPSKK